MSDWQPIETAPKDGTAIMLYSPGKNGGRWITRWKEPEVQWVVVKDGPEILSGDMEKKPRRDRIPPPTHWMPLPAPPPAPLVGLTAAAATQAETTMPPEERKA